MHVDPAIPQFVLVILSILIIGIVMRRLKQPHVLIYLLAGIVLGPHVFGVISDYDTLTRLGSIGVVLLLFFVGMEVSPKRLAENWLIAIVGTLLQVIISIAAVGIIGTYMLWPVTHSVLLGFVMALSSTAVALKLLQDWKQIDTRVGQDVVGILLVQDLLVVPMLIILSFIGGQQLTFEKIMLQIIGGCLLLALTVWIIKKEEISLPWLRYIGSDHEMQVFTSLGICFGMALLTGLVNLSSAIGAFFGGMIVSSARETFWVYNSLSSIRTIFIALFFVSVGMLINFAFIWENIWQITSITVLAFTVNFAINTSILKALGEAWDVSLYGGSLLSQIGEFSFVIAGAGYQMQIIDKFTHQMIISVISITLLLSPPWIAIIKSARRITIKKLNV